ncbi:MAG: IS21 family transposase [Solirubrobacterales bacterium]
MVSVERWAEIRRMHRVEELSIREIARRTGLHRKTIRRALRSPQPPRYRRTPKPSKLDPHREEIARLLRDHDGITNTRIRELITEDGFEGGKTILDDHLRELRPIICPARTHQRTIYRPGELCQFDLWEPKGEIPVGHGQTRRGFFVTAELGYSRALAGALIFSKTAPDILWGMGRCLRRLGGLPKTAVWDREGAIAPKGRPTEPFLAFCGELSLGWLILEAADPESKGALERSHRFMRTNFESARRFANERDCQLQFDAWTDRVNQRRHRGTRAVVAERLAAELSLMSPLPERMPKPHHRVVTRVPQQPYLRFDTNDYSIDPRFAGRRVELHVGQRELVAVVLGTGEAACRHRRRFAKHLTLTDPTHQAELDRLRGRRRRGPDVDVEARPLARYDALIGA